MISRSNRNLNKTLLVTEIVHLMPQRSDFSFEPFYAQYFLVLHDLIILTICIVPMAPLTGTISIASDFGSSAVDTGIDSASLARPLD
jgi:hypothetical protein